MSALPNQPPDQNYYRRLAEAYRARTEDRPVEPPPNAREWLPPFPAFDLDPEEHGDFAPDVLLAGEDQTQFARYRKAFFDRWQPADGVEALSVERLAVINWTLLRCKRIEQGLLLHHLHDIAYNQTYFGRYYPALSAPFAEDRSPKPRRSSLHYDPRWMEEIYKKLDEEPEPCKIEAARRHIQSEFDYDFCPPIPNRVLGWTFEHDNRHKNALLRLAQYEQLLEKSREREQKHLETLRKTRPQAA